MDHVEFGESLAEPNANFHGFQQYKDKVLVKNEFHFSVFRVQNGYVFDNNSTYRGETYNGQAKYVPDIDGILREVALAIGGEDAVPVLPVSPVEAGLIDDEQLPLNLATSTATDAAYGGICDTQLARSAVEYTNHSEAVYDCQGKGSISVEPELRVPTAPQPSVTSLVDAYRDAMRVAYPNEPHLATQGLNRVFNVHGFRDYEHYMAADAYRRNPYAIADSLTRAIASIGTSDADTKSDNLGVRRNG